MGYEVYLRALGEAELPWHGMCSWYLASAVGKSPQLASAYLTRLHKMGFVRRRIWRSGRRGRPLYFYALSQRGREHLRWLVTDYPDLALAEFRRFARESKEKPQWSTEIEAWSKRYTRRLETELDRAVAELFFTKTQGAWLRAENFRRRG